MVDALPAMLLWQTGFESYVCGGPRVVSFIILEPGIVCFISSWAVCVGQFAGRCCSYTCIIFLFQYVIHIWLASASCLVYLRQVA